MSVYSRRIFIQAEYVHSQNVLTVYGLLLFTWQDCFIVIPLLAEPKRVERPWEHEVTKLLDFAAVS